MRRPRFSVVIPTRERADTLRHCLRTCLEQDFDDYEVVVCDNCSSPATRGAVDEADSPRVRYLRSDRPLAMSDNWELAVGQARGEYVTVLGDDDGLLSCALRELNRLIERHGRPGAVQWLPGLYTWPTIAVAEEANYLRLPLDRTARLLDGRAQLLRAARWEIGADSLPMIYRAVIRRDLIERHRRIAGRVFPNRYPDVYSGFAFAFLAGTYLSVHAPLGLSGLSGRSNGVATLMRTDDNPIAEEFQRLHGEAGYRRHPTVPDVELLPVNGDDSFQHARDLLFPGDPELTLDRRRATERYLAAIPDTDPEARARVRAKIRAALADRPDLLEWFDNEAPDPPPAPPFRCRPERFGYDGWGLTVDTTRFGVTDIAGAVRLAADLLGFGAEEILYDLPTRTDTDLAWTAALARQQGALTQADAQAQAARAELEAARAEAESRHQEVEALRQQADDLAREKSELQRRLGQALYDGALRHFPRRLFHKLAAMLRR